jgi:hypothetical protein
LPVAANFKYGYAQQGNLTIERAFSNSWKVSVGYQFTRGHSPESASRHQFDRSPAAVTERIERRTFRAEREQSVTVVVPSGAPNSCVNQGSGSIFLIAPGALGQGFAAPNCNAAAAVGFVGTPAYFNFFRPSGPNPSFAVATPGRLRHTGGIGAACGISDGLRSSGAVQQRRLRNSRMRARGTTR